MHALLDRLGRRGADALRGAFGDLPALPAVIPVVRSAKSDLQTAAALQLAKALGKPPRAIAEVLRAALAGDPAVEATEIAGAGFVNVKLTDDALRDEASRLLDLPQIGAGQRVVIDYSSPNVAKPMHIGHIRSTIIGEALKRTLRAVGYEVIGDNHLGDWGTQFGKLLVAWRAWLDPVAFEKAPVDELLRLYVKFVDEEKKQARELGLDKKAPKAAAKPDERKGAEGDDPVADVEDGEVEEARATPLLTAARAALVELQRGDEASVALWRRFIDVSMSEFERVYRRLGVTFDVVLGESFYNDRLASTVALLREKGLAVESRGALVVRFDDGDDAPNEGAAPAAEAAPAAPVKDGKAKKPATTKMPPTIVRKGDGGFNYATTDVAGLLYRIERWSPARILVVTDERQKLHFKQVFEIGRRLGVEASLEHVPFGLMRLPEGTISTRDGNLIGLEALLDEAERRAVVVARELDADLDEAGLREVGRVVGLGAVKYNDLAKDRETLVTFTWDKALAMQGNTAPYMLYAYARTRSVLRKAAAQGAAPGALGELGASERDLLMKLLAFDLAVLEVAKTAKPHGLCEHLFEVAGAFSSFWTDVPVLNAEPALRASRLTLCELTSNVLARGLDLLGIEVVERM